MSEPTTAGRWTTEPPTVPGWYWFRIYNTCALLAVNVRSANADGISNLYYIVHGNIVQLGVAGIGEWWTIPIQEPPR